jgi:hypothetical protein
MRIAFGRMKTLKHIIAGHSAASLTLAFAVAGGGMALSASAASRWAILTEAGERRAAAVEFTADGSALVLKQDDGGSARLPLSEVAALTQQFATTPGRGATNPAVRRFYAELLSRERVLAETMDLSGATFTLGNTNWGKVELAVTSVWRLVATDARLAAAPPDFTGVRYVNGDSVAGAVVWLSGARVLVDMPGVGKIPVDDLATVADIVLCKTAALPPLDRGMEVSLRTGERFRGTCAGGSNGVMRFKTTWARKPLNIPLAMISAAVMLDGRVLLSGVATKSAAATPFLGFHRPAVRDRALTGGVLSVDGFAAARGIALYAGTTLDFPLLAAPGGTRLLAWVGVDDLIPAGMGSAGFKVMADGNMVHTAQLEAGGGLIPLVIEIPANAAVLSLSASYGPLGSAGGHVDVLYPLLKPQPVAEVKP